MTQATLFAEIEASGALVPAYWCDAWRIPLLEEIPVPGMASAKSWKDCAPGTTDYPGRNHPGMGRWLWNRYLPPGTAWAADPMIGVGGLWLWTGAHVRGCDVSPRAVELAQKNLPWPREIEVGSAASWSPRSTELAAPLVMFSPPYFQSHSSGASAHQLEIAKKKRTAAVQAFEARFPDMRQVYANIWSWTEQAGRMIVILRNRIVAGREVDDVGEHIRLMRETGWTIEGAHPRDLERPTVYQAWKLAKNPALPWIRYEWAVVAV